MLAVIQQILTILTTPPGNLAYHIVLAFSVTVTLLVAINLWQGIGFPANRRLATGLVLLFASQFALFLLSGLGWQFFYLPDPLLPIFDRAIAAFSLALIAWLWVFPQPIRLADAATALLGLLILTLAAFTWVGWIGRGEGAYFNGTLADWLWGILSLAIVLIGVLLLLVRRPDGWGVGVAMLLVLFGGHLLHLVAPAAGSHFSGIIRLAQLAAYPLLLFLPQRFPTPSLAYESASPPAALEGRRSAPDPRLVTSFLALAADDRPADLYRAIPRAVALSTLADLCLLVSPPDPEGGMPIQCGYDLIREETLEGSYLESGQVPTLATALRRGRPLRLPASSTAVDLASLSRALNLDSCGPLLAVPLLTPNHAETSRWDAPPLPIGLVLLSPYSNRAWTARDQGYLLDLAKPLSRLLLRTRQVQILQEKLSQAEERYRELSAQAENLQEQAARERGRAESLVAAQEANQETITRLRAENKRLRRSTRESPLGEDLKAQEMDHYEGEIRLALEEIARLRGLLAEADQKVLAMQKEQARPPTITEQEEVIASLAQELRQPMSSILGYTDLLLNESAGILGALQRKFLERIKVSTERIGRLVQDLIQVASLDREEFVLAPEPVDLRQVIEEALAQTDAQVHEKNLSLRLDLPVAIPRIQADRDALQQVLVYLLQNAIAATPGDGQVALLARVENTHAQEDYLLLQVTDQGGGIPPEDLPRVFSRLYRADNPLIQGVGDTGVGLSIVKKLVDAQGGRVWVDSHVGEGSTFNVILPFSPPPPSHDNRQDGREGMEDPRARKG